jgi:hypothetical protein
MRFPILVGYGRKAEITFLHLVPRPKNAFFLTDSLAMNLTEYPSFLSDFLAWAGRFFPRAVDWQVDWPEDEQEIIREVFKLSSPVYLFGDSWTLPLFLAFDLLFGHRAWPEGILASGAVRRSRGLRCLSIGRARFKLRRARAENCRLMLPQSNVRALSQAGWEVEDCLSLPPNLETCLGLWRSL